jgi:tetratricopeptide (TPR) repeat protein
MRLQTGLSLIVVMCLLLSCATLDVRLEAQSAFEKGLALFNQGRYEASIPHFVRATELDPNFGRAYLYLGRSYVSLRRWLEAITPLRTALRLSPEETRQEAIQILIDALLGAATFELKQGDISSSIGLLREVLGLQPQSPQATRQLVSALIMLGNERLSQGQVVDAINAYKEVSQLAPHNLDAYLGMARAFLQQGEVPQALIAIQKALRLAPTNLDAVLLFQQIQRR